VQQLVDDEIQFGEVEHASPQESLRPDRNKHYAVVEYGSPDDRDLPIFVDLDVLADMEDHALSDTSVELGGVLLGQTCTDDAGRPFIVVTDSLRAQHYESTKGSFKFTHDTWEAITRERDEFPPELAMVGWYHTHPDWGVFLSGMDMFICDNFFNKPLDIAYVIDPCRQDRGMFQWTGDERQRVRRTGGFFVMASRFRAAELEHFVAELSGTMPATSSRTVAGAHGGAPVVHLHQPPQPPPPAWQAPAVVGMLALQFCLLALIAWRMIEPPAGTPGERAASGAGEFASEQLVTRSALAAERARNAYLTETIVETPEAAAKLVERLQVESARADRVEGDVAARDAQLREQSATLADLNRRLAALEKTSDESAAKFQDRINTLTEKNERLLATNDKLTTELAAFRKTENAAAGDEAAKTSIWWYIGGGIAAALVLAVGAVVGGKLWLDKPEDETADAEDAPNKEPGTNDQAPVTSDQ
jgi:proteasome lid subunit RPN8/RPN11